MDEFSQGKDSKVNVKAKGTERSQDHDDEDAELFKERKGTRVSFDRESPLVEDTSTDLREVQPWMNML